MKLNATEHSSNKVVTQQDNHAHNNEIDLCTPFCVCNCCGQQILNFNHQITFEFKKFPTEISTQIPTYKSILTSSFFGSIWQPPQIV